MTHRQARAALVVITLLWGVSITAVKGLLGHATPMLAVGVRFGLAGLLLLPFLKGLTAAERRGGTIIGLVFAAGVVFQNLGLNLTTASRSAFIVALSALLTPAVGALVLRHRVAPAILVRIVAAIGGVFLLTAPGGSLASINRGDLLTLVSAVLYAGQIVAVGHFVRGSSAVRLLAVQLLCAGLAGWALSPVLETPRFDWSPGVALLVAALVAISLTTFGLQFRAQKLVTASEAALVFTFEPVVTALTSWLAFGEVLLPAQWLGAAVILVAVGLPARQAPGIEPGTGAPS